jgi:hypothetical protein
LKNKLTNREGRELIATILVMMSLLLIGVLIILSFGVGENSGYSDGVLRTCSSVCSYLGGGHQYTSTVEVGRKVTTYGLEKDDKCVCYPTNGNPKYPTIIIPLTDVR